jgi:hypothetical protein
METMHIITKEDDHQESTERVDKGDDTAVGIIKEGETR